MFPNRSLRWTLALLLATASSASAAVTLQIGQSRAPAPLPLVNGRQIAQSSAGLWFAVYEGRIDGGEAVFIAVSKGKEPGLAGDFHPPVLLAGSSQQAIAVEGPEGRTAPVS